MDWIKLNYGIEAPLDDPHNQSEFQRCSDWIENENFNNYQDGILGFIEVTTDANHAKVYLENLDGFKLIGSNYFNFKSGRERWRAYSNGIELLLLIIRYDIDGEQSIIIGHPDRLEQIENI